MGEFKRKRENGDALEFTAFTMISGLISFSYNVVMTVIPLRMADRGLGYDRIGGAMSAVAVGLLVVKLVFGHLSDRLGTKRFILTALLGLAVVSVLLGRADDLASYAVLMAALGIFRGIFLAVNGSFVMDMAEGGGYGKICSVSVRNSDGSIRHMGRVCAEKEYAGIREKAASDSDFLFHEQTDSSVLPDRVPAVFCSRTHVEFPDSDVLL